MMSDFGEEFGDASVQYGDWRGTAALDEGDQEDLYAAAGINRDEWRIVGLDLYGGYGSSGARILAVPAPLYPNFEALDAASSRGARIEATAYELPYGTEQVLRRFKRWNIHATGHGIKLDIVIKDVP